jgi:hypothetical protein
MACQDCDKRKECGDKLPSVCVDYTGKISPLIKDKIKCSPNVDDILEQVQIVIENIKKTLGDNTKLNKKCLTSLDPLTVTQQGINQKFIDEICALKTLVADLDLPDASTILITIDLLCLENVNCDIPTAYTLLDILQRIITKICNLETRVQAIETLLNI